MVYISHFLKNFYTIILSLIFTSSLASAQEVDPARFTANPGIYDPITFGDDITFNACNSTFQSFTLCSLESLEEFELTWRVAPEGEDILAAGTLVALYGAGSTSINNAGATGNTTIVDDTPRLGVNFIANTGDRSNFFPTPGRYTLELGLLVRGGTSVTIGDDTFTVGSRTGLFTSGQTVIDIVGAPTAPPSTVPEPAGYLILIPAFYFMARRQRKLKIQYA
jgi:hypothetical protein